MSDPAGYDGRTMPEARQPEWEPGTYGLPHGPREKKPKFEGVDQGNTEKAGGTRYSAGKPVMTWAPWLGMMEVCRVSEMGAEKYAPFDWLEGQSFSTLMSSAMRHMLKAVMDPMSRDPDSGLLHLGHAAWNILCALHFIEQGRDHLFDDVSVWYGVTAEEYHKVRGSMEARKEARKASAAEVLERAGKPF